LHDTNKANRRNEEAIGKDDDKDGVWDEIFAANPSEPKGI
jgi:hypothetical protein